MDVLLPDMFPWRTTDESYLGVSLPHELGGTRPPYGRYSGVYGHVCDPEAALSHLGPQLKTETIAGRRLEPGEHPITVPAGCALPVLALAATDLAMRTGDTGLGSVPLPPRRWRHLRFDDGFDGHARISGPVVVGDPLPIGPRRPSPGSAARPLVLLIFIDGLSQAMLTAAGPQSLMPRVCEYFSTGLTFTNCYATGEWTLTNVASVFTGRYTSGHNMFHPRRPMILGPQPILSEHMKAAGYTCVSIGANWRATPAYGYARGFDRTVYQKGMSGAQVIADLIDQLAVLGEQPVFAYASFMDIHWKCEDVLPDISVQLDKSLATQLREPPEIGLTPIYQGGYDEENIEAYLAQVRRLDRTLGVLFDYLNECHPESTVVLFADHGQSFNSRFEYTWELADARLRVPLMVRGPAVAAGRPDEFVELVDVGRILTAVSAVAAPTDHADGRLPAWLGGRARQYAYAESRYPGRLFRAAVTERDRKYLLTSAGRIDDDGMFDLGEPELLAYRPRSEECALDRLPWETRYTDLIIERSRHWMRDRRT
ncbi:sulfatase-like hydrolase/transferase [Dactylosporangium sp. CA-139066]|uniref:sulfatase-like hydrolase/transferase n=1 Tax=Dactylosporangium sp. CA-139066 TaxID=3239930 RepID=UPI003D8D30FD